MFKKITCNSDAHVIFLILIFIVGLTGCIAKIGKDEFGSFPGTSKIIFAPDSNSTKNIDVAIPPSTLDLFACIQCHKEVKVNTQKRVLTSTHIDFVFDHPGYDSENKWCYSCHYTLTLDSLRFESGKLLSYERSYELCVQCHVTKYADWEVGIHGKRTGEWNGKKQYLSCLYCHNPHSPKFKPIESMKPPFKPTKFQ